MFLVIFGCYGILNTIDKPFHEKGADTTKNPNFPSARVSNG